MKNMSFKAVKELVESGKVVTLVTDTVAKEKVAIRLLEEYPNTEVHPYHIKNIKFIGPDDMLHPAMQSKLLNVSRLVIRKMRQRVTL